MTIDAFIAFLAVPFLQEVAAYGNFVLMEDVKVIALVALLALPFKPVNTYDLLVLRLVSLEILALVEGEELVER